MLLFGMLGGTFVRIDFSAATRFLSYLTPNSWAINGFTQLGLGGGIGDISGSLIALSVMTIILLSVAAAVFSRKDI